MKGIARLLLSILIVLSLSLTGFAQEKIKSVDQLIFMKGNWTGTGWIIGKDRLKKTFSQSEIIKSKADNLVLMVDGLGLEIDSLGKITDRVIHKAFGIISYNKDRESVTMISFSEMRGRMESDFELIDKKKIRWSFKEANGATIRFTEDFTDDGKWKEVGEVSMNGKDWYQFFEMNLIRKSLK